VDPYATALASPTPKSQAPPVSPQDFNKLFSDVDVKKKVEILTPAGEEALQKQRLESHLQREIQNLIETVDETKLDGFLPPNLLQYSNALHHDQILKLKRTFYEVEKAKQFEEFKKAQGTATKYLKPIQFLSEWHKFEPIPPHPVKKQPEDTKKQTDSPPPPPKPSSPPAGQKGEAEAPAQPVQSAWTPVEGESVEFEIPSTFEGVWNIYRRLRQLEKAKKFVAMYSQNPEDYKDPEIDEMLLYKESIEVTNKDYQVPEVEWKKADELAKKLGTHLNRSKASKSRPPFRSFCRPFLLSPLFSRDLFFFWTCICCEGVELVY